MAKLDSTTVYGDLKVTGGINNLSVSGVGGSLSLAGAYGLNITLTGNTNITFPTSGTLEVVGHTHSYMPLGGGTFTGAVTFPGSNVFQSDGKVGLGVTPSYRLDVSGDIRCNGQLRLTAASETSPMIVTSTTKVANLNADLLDGYDSVDFYNRSIDIGGHGVLYGCTVQAISPTPALGVKLNEGRVLIKDYGIVNIQGTNVTSGFQAGNYHIVFIAGKTEQTYTVGQVAVIRSTTGWPDMSALTNPIVLAKVHTADTVILDTEIYNCRDMVAIKTDTEEKAIKIWESDKENQTVSSTSLTTVTRLSLAKNGDRTQIVLSDIPDVNNKVKKVVFDSDTITFWNDTTQATVTAAKVSAWDDAGSKRHTHFYDAPWSGPTNGGRTFSVSSGHSLPPNKTRVYKNGLRQKMNTNNSTSTLDNDYYVSGNSVTFNTAPLSTDTIIIDYDL